MSRDCRVHLVNQDQKASKDKQVYREKWVKLVTTVQQYPVHKENVVTEATLVNKETGESEATAVTVVPKVLVETLGKAVSTAKMAKLVLRGLKARLEMQGRQDRQAETVSMLREVKRG